jgi:UTP--glucose-1-phosphate uridylyltransferase
MVDESLCLVIPAAGLGKRMRTVTPNLPKEMLPIINKPAILYAVEEGLSAGIKNIIIIINRQKEMIRKYFEDSEFAIERECSITFLYQREPIGESDAIGLAEDIVGSHAMAIIYPDNIYFPAPGVLNILKAIFRKYGKDVVALMEVTNENSQGISNSGRVDLSLLENDVFLVERFYPKGEGCFVPRFKGELRTCGFTISGSHIFEYIKRLRYSIKEPEFTDVPVRSFVLNEKGLLGCRLPGTVFDIGNPQGYELCLSYVRKEH